MEGHEELWGEIGCIEPNKRSEAFGTRANHTHQAGYPCPVNITKN
jgi:hypothetical protein